MGLLDTPFAFRFRKGTKIFIDVKDFIQVNIFFHKYYEKPESLVWLEFCNSADVIFDVGANVGYYSLLAASDPLKQVFSFEPVSFTFEKLRRNIALNKFRNVTAVRSVVSNRAEAIKIYFRDSLNMGMSSVVPSQENTAFEEVQGITLDEFVRQKEIKRVDLVKIDVEGSEVLVLEGMKSVLTHSRPALMMEVTQETLERFGYTVENLYKYLGDLGYQAYDIIGERVISKIHTPKEKIGLLLFVHSDAIIPPAIKMEKEPNRSQQIPKVPN
jgi:FkbM family methyltransferase